MLRRGDQDHLLLIEGYRDHFRVADGALQPHMHLVRQYHLDDLVRIFGAHANIEARIA